MRPNRLPNYQLPSDSELKKRCRGAFAEKITTVDDSIQLLAVRWFDNRAVTFLSSLAGAQPVATVHRWDRVEKVDKQIPCPDYIQSSYGRSGFAGLIDWPVPLLNTFKEMVSQDFLSFV